MNKLPSSGQPPQSSSPTQGFKSRPEPPVSGFFLFPVRSGTVNRVWFFIFYASKSKNMKVIFLCYCSGFKQCHRFLKPCLGHGRVEDVASLLQIADLRLARSLLRRDDRRRPRTELRAYRLNEVTSRPASCRWRRIMGAFGWAVALSKIVVGCDLWKSNFGKVAVGWLEARLVKLLWLLKKSPHLLCGSHMS